MGAATVNSAQAVNAARRSERFLMTLPSSYGESGAGRSDAGRPLEVTGSSQHRAGRFEAPRILAWPLLPPESSSSSSRSIAPS
jgi:hypothetical protein